MAIEFDSTYRIRRNVDYERQMKELVEAHIFDAYKSILMLSAVLGYVHHARVPFDQTAERVHMTNFTSEECNIMEMLAFVSTKEHAILRKIDKYKYFEEFANGGFPILMEMLDWDKRVVEAGGVNFIDSEESVKIVRGLAQKILV